MGSSGTHCVYAANKMELPDSSIACVLSSEALSACGLKTALQTYTKGAEGVELHSWNDSSSPSSSGSLSEAALALT